MTKSRAASSLPPGVQSFAGPIVQPSDFQLSGPYNHANLSVFLVHGADQFCDSGLLTLQEALDQKKAIVHETGNVNELTVENQSADEELYIQSGDIVKGGQQDRTLHYDLIVAPGSGMVPLATGSDGGGSIRIPSALCGLSGFKPSLGRVPAGGVNPPDWPDLSTRGPMARRTADLALVLDAVIGPEPLDLRSLPMPDPSWAAAVEDPHVPIKVGWSPTLGYAEVDADIKRVLDSATGGFHDEFQNRSQPFVEVVKKVQSKTEGTIAEAGLVSCTKEQAQVLIAISVKTSMGTAPPDPEPRRWRYAPESRQLRLRTSEPPWRAACP